MDCSGVEHDLLILSSALAERARRKDVKTGKIPQPASAALEPITLCCKIITENCASCIQNLPELDGRTVMDVLWLLMYEDISAHRSLAKPGNDTAVLKLQECLQYHYSLTVKTIQALSSLLLEKESFELTGGATGLDVDVITELDAPLSPCVGLDTSQEYTSKRMYQRSEDIKHCIGAVCANAGDIVRYMIQARSPVSAVEGLLLPSILRLTSESDTHNSAMAKYYQTSVLCRPTSSHAHHKMALLAQQKKCLPLFQYHLLTAWSNSSLLFRDAVSLSLKQDLNKLFSDIVKMASALRGNSIIKRLGAVSRTHLAEGMYISVDIPLLTAASVRLKSRSKQKTAPKSATKTATPIDYRPVLVHKAVMQDIFEAAQTTSAGLTVSAATYETTDCHELLALRTMPVRQIYVAWLLTRAAELAALVATGSPSCVSLSQALSFDLKRALYAQQDALSCKDGMGSGIGGALLPNRCRRGSETPFGATSDSCHILSVRWVVRIIVTFLHACIFCANTTESGSDTRSKESSIMSASSATVHLLRTLCHVLTMMMQRALLEDLPSTQHGLLRAGERPTKRPRVESALCAASSVNPKAPCMSEHCLYQLRAISLPLLLVMHATKALKNLELLNADAVGLKRFRESLRVAQSVIQEAIARCAAPDAAPASLRLWGSEFLDLIGSGVLRESFAESIAACPLSGLLIDGLARCEEMACANRAEPLPDAAFSVSTITSMIPPESASPYSLETLLKQRLEESGVICDGILSLWEPPHHATRTAHVEVTHECTASFATQSTDNS